MALAILSSVWLCGAGVCTWFLQHVESLPGPGPACCCLLLITSQPGGHRASACGAPRECTGQVQDDWQKNRNIPVSKATFPQSFGFPATEHHVSRSHKRMALPKETAFASTCSPRTRTLLVMSGCPIQQLPKHTLNATTAPGFSWGRHCREGGMTNKGPHSSLTLLIVSL